MAHGTTLATNPTYRNIRPNYYSDKASDTTEIGTIITTLKADDATVYDNSTVPLATPNWNQTTGQITRTQSGDAQTETNPDFQFPGYVYCDGSRYKIGDYPALYKVVGTDYGGAVRKGLVITNGGTGYPASGMTITFAAPPGNATDNETIEGTVTVVGGVVTDITTTKLGKNYSENTATPPTFTVANAGTGSGLALEFNFNASGTLEDITPSNVFSHLGETRSLGEFCVPDLKTRKILGYGNVYGVGSPTAGLLTTGAGATKTGGSYLLTKDTQKGYFSLGTITTVDYTKVTDTTPTTISGQQIMKVSMDEKRLQDVPQHSHFVYHTEAGQDMQTNASYAGDRYLAGYTDRNARLYQWFPIGGIAFGHKHALLKQPLADPTVATYDIMDYVPGAAGTGSLKTATASSPPITHTVNQSAVTLSGTNADSIAITGHGFVTGNQITYTTGDVVHSVATGNINVSNDQITVTGHGLTTSDVTRYGQGIITWAVSAPSEVSTTNNTITLTSHGLTAGTGLKYVSNNGSTAIGGITIGFTYYVSIVDANTVKLHSTVGEATAGAPVINLTNAGNGAQMFSVVGSPATPLVDGLNYYAIRIDDNTLRLATTSANATAGTDIDITSNGSGVHTLTSAGTVITPLSSSSTYYVIRVDDNRIKLASTLAQAQANTAIDLTALGTGNFTIYKAAVTGSGFYMASGGAGSGTYEVVSTIPVPVFRKFGSSSVVGGRQVTTGGVPIITYPNGLQTKTTPTNGSPQTISFPTAWATLSMEVAGAGGGGSPGNAKGNDGAKSEFVIGSLLTITANGGKGGGSSAARTDGGDGGTFNVGGTKAGSVTTITTVNGQNGNNGVAGNFYKKTYPSSPNQSGNGGGIGSGTAGQGGNGGDGKHTLISDTSNPGSQSAVQGTGSISLASTNYLYDSIQITLAGGRGGQPQKRHGACNQTGGAGDILVISVNAPANGWSGSYATGTQGADNQNSPGTPGSMAWGANGGSGGHRNGGGSFGAGGGAATGLRDSANQLVAGAGGGGGGGGDDSSWGGGACGQTGVSNDTPGWNSNNAQSTNETLFTGSGIGGNNAGCYGGGGGGGGGGISNDDFSWVGGGSSGAGGGANAGHGGAGGGGRGMSAFKNTMFSKVSQSTSNMGHGYVSWAWNEDRSYWTNGGGGGGEGAYAYITATQSQLGTTSGLTGTWDVGGAGSAVGGAGVGENGYIKYGFGEVTGWQGGSTSTTVGDIVIKASGTADDGINIYVSGTGTGGGGNFKLPITQPNTVEFVGGGGGSGASATTSIANEITNSITLSAGGTGYTQVPEVRIKDGAGSGAYATVTKDNSNVVDTIALSTLSVRSSYSHFVKFEGTQTERYINLKEFDCTNVKRFNIKCARGNGNNGGDLPEHGGDELKLYYNTDLSDSFTNFIGVIVPVPTSSEVTSNYDGTGTGTNPTNWYWYSVDLPTAAQTANTRFQIKQSRSQGSDVSTSSDHYAICDFIYEYDAVDVTTFIPTDGSISTSADELTYTVEGREDSIYTSGATGLDATFTLSATNPLIPAAAIDPDFPIPLVEPYHVVKYLIKAI